MLDLGKEAARLAQQPSAERLQALKRIIPCSTIKSILRSAGKRRSCSRLPDWFMVWFVVGLGLFNGDKYRWSLRFTVINLTDKTALYNFLSTFSGTHYVTPRTETVELGFHF